MKVLGFGLQHNDTVVIMRLPSARRLPRMLETLW
jgi:hypothetical protein